MMIAEALLLRADMLKKLASLKERIARNAVVQEGDAPHEDPAALIEESRAVGRELEDLDRRIHRTNLKHALPDGRTITDVVVHREGLVRHHALLGHAIEHSQKEPDRYGMHEIKWVSQLKVSELQKQVDALAKEIRELNAALQKANWDAELEG
jgi:hypothetical protein